MSNDRVRLELLGPPRIQVGDQVHTSFRSNRVIALLGFLAIQERSVTREEAAAALWPEKSDDAARHNLRQTLLYIRHLLGPTAVLTDRSSIELDKSVHSDVQGLLNADEEPLALTDGQALVRSYRGPFLSGVDDLWAVEARERVSQCFLELLGRLSDSALAIRPDLALEFASTAVRQEPLQDGARARKIRALKALGEHARAEKEYFDFAQLLEDELDIQPAPMVRAALSAAPSTSQELEAPLAFESQAMESLKLAGRPDQALDLAIALTPCWIANGQAHAGLALLRSVKAPGSMKVDRINLAIGCEGELLVATGAFAEAHALLSRVSGSTHSRGVRCRALHAESRLALYRYRTARGLACAQEALSLARDKELPYMTLACLRTAALAALQAGDLGLSEEFARETNAYAERLGDVTSQVGGLLTLAQARERAKDVAGARQTLAAARKLMPRLSPAQLLRAQVSASRLLDGIGELDAAERGYRDCIVSATSQNNDVTKAIVLTYLGDLLSAVGDYPQAEAIHRQAIEIRSRSQDTLGLATSQRGLGRALLEQHELLKAKKELAESARGFMEAEAMPGYASALFLLARTEAALGRPAAARRLATRSLQLAQGMAPHQRASIGPTGERLLDDAKALLASLSS